MKNIFTHDVKKTLFESVFIALLVFLSQNYLQRLWAPVVAAETLKKQNYISSKRDVYFEAIELTNRQISGITFDTLKTLDNHFVRLKGATTPTEYEYNNCLTKLYLYTDSQELIDNFKKIAGFKTGRSGSVIEAYISMIKNIKKDLSGSDKNDSFINSYEYILVTKDTTFK